MSCGMDDKWDCSYYWDNAFDDLLSCLSDRDDSSQSDAVHNSWSLTDSAFCDVGANLSDRDSILDDDFTVCEADASTDSVGNTSCSQNACGATVSVSSFTIPHTVASHPTHEPGQGSCVMTGTESKFWKLSLTGTTADGEMVSKSNSNEHSECSRASSLNGCSSGSSSNFTTASTNQPSFCSPFDFMLSRKRNDVSSFVDGMPLLFAVDNSNNSANTADYCSANTMSNFAETGQASRFRPALGHVSSRKKNEFQQNKSLLAAKPWPLAGACPRIRVPEPVAVMSLMNTMHRCGRAIRNHPWRISWPLFYFLCGVSLGLCFAFFAFHVQTTSCQTSLSECQHQRDSLRQSQNKPSQASLEETVNSIWREKFQEMVMENAELQQTLSSLVAQMSCSLCTAHCRVDALKSGLSLLKEDTGMILHKTKDAEHCTIDAAC